MSATKKNISEATRASHGFHPKQGHDNCTIKVIWVNLSSHIARQILIWNTEYVPEEEKDSFEMLQGLIRIGKIMDQGTKLNVHIYMTHFLNLGFTILSYDFNKILPNSLRNRKEN